MAVRESKKQNPEQNPEEMSVAELVGDDATAPQRVTRAKANGKRGEPDSGLIRLSEMIEQASADSDDRGSIVTGQFPIESLPPAPVAAAPAPSKSHKGLYLIIVLLIGAMVGGYFYVQNLREADRADLAAAKAQIEQEKAELRAAQEKAAKLEQEKAAGTISLEKQKELEALKTQIAADAAKLEEKEAAVAKEEPTEVAVAPTKPKATKPASARKPAATRRPATKPAASTPTKAPTPAAKPAPKPKAAPATQPAATKSKNLDSLLGPATPKRQASATPAAPKSSAKNLSRSAIRKAMRPVESKAQTCARYATGTVRLQITVEGSSGKVKAAKATGSFANNNAGRCVSMLARTAKFPTFSAPSQTFTHPIVLR